MFAQRDHISDTRVLVSLRLPTQTWTSVSETSTTVSQARSVSTHWGPSPASVRMVTARLAPSASVRIQPLTGLAEKNIPSCIALLSTPPPEGRDGLCLFQTSTSAGTATASTAASTSPDPSPASANPASSWQGTTAPASVSGPPRSF